MRKLLLSIIVCVAVAIGISRGCSQNRKEIELVVMHTTNVQHDWMVEFLHKSLVSLAIDDVGAHFQTPNDRSRFCLGNPEAVSSLNPMKFSSEFTLSKPGEMFWSPDHHGSRIFTVKRITTGEIVLSYRMTMNYRSFGKNLFTIDEGEFTLEPIQEP